MSAVPAYFPCHCNAAYHLILVTPDADIPGAFNFEVVTHRGGGGFSQRLGHALNFLFCGGDLVEGDVILDADNAKRMASLLSGGGA